MPEAIKQQKKILHKRAAIKTVAFYLVLACLWIYFSDKIAALFITDPASLTRIQTIKGLLYVIVTSLLLYLYLNHCLQTLRNKEDDLELERERTQQETREQLKQLSTLFDSMSAIVYVADIENYELLYVNKYAAEHFGHDWQDAKCYHYLQAGTESPCDFCTNQQLIERGEAGEPLVWEFLNTKNNRWYNCIDKTIRWTDDRLARLEIAYDITERKELETLKDELLSSMSHEMRTPLTAISGFAELLADDPDISEQNRRHIEIIFRETEKLTELVNRFLDIRRLKSDRSRTNYLHLNLFELLKKARQQCHTCKPHHNISIECPDDLTVHGNRKELTQVFKQFLDNACLYSPEGGNIQVIARTDNNQISISFRDQGIGIPQHALDSIFQPFYRLDTGDTRRTSGVGLGLSVAREIISLHGGKITVESTEGKGSLFTLTLPDTPSYSSSTNTRT